MVSLHSGIRHKVECLKGRQENYIFCKNFRGAKTLLEKETSLGKIDVIEGKQVPVLELLLLL